MKFKHEIQTFLTAVSYSDDEINSMDVKRESTDNQSQLKSRLKFTTNNLKIT